MLLLLYACVGVFGDREGYGIPLPTHARKIKADVYAADVFTFHTDFSVSIGLLSLQLKCLARSNATVHAFVEHRVGNEAVCHNDYVTCVSPLDTPEASVNHAHVLDYALSRIANRSAPVLFLDGDVLPINRVNISEYHNYCVAQDWGPNYCWPGLLGFVPSTFRHRSFVPGNGGDTGQQTSILRATARIATIPAMQCALVNIPTPVFTYDRAWMHVLSHTSTWRYAASLIQRNSAALRIALHQGDLLRGAVCKPQQI